MDEYLKNNPESESANIGNGTQPIVANNTPVTPVQPEFQTPTPPAQTSEFTPPIQPVTAQPEGFVPPVSNPQPVYNPINISPVTPENENKSTNKGLRVFALILAIVIGLTGTSLAGYFIGKNSNVQSFINNSDIEVDLAAKPENTDELTSAQVYEKVNPSIVGITVYNASGEGGQASGIVFSDDGYIVTNDHIYADVANPKFMVHAYDGTEYTAEFVAGDLISDLAVLKIKGGKLEPAVFGNSDELYMGQSVVAIGRPNDATDTTSITRGVISALNRRVSNTSSYSARLIQTDSAINPGSSGGSLVNMYGQVIGVTSSKLASVEYEGVGYAIPTTVMKRIVEELISEGKVVTRAKLGITYTFINSVLAEMNNMKHTGLLVDSVANDSDLKDKIGKGDLITKINGIDITSDDLVLDIIEKCRAGDQITVTVYTSQGETKEFTAELKANIGESSYISEKPSTNESKESNGGIFDFPSGE